MKKHIAYWMALACIFLAGCGVGENGFHSEGGNFQAAPPTEDQQAPDDSTELADTGGNPDDDSKTPDPCSHPQFRVAVDSQPVWSTVVHWYYEHNESRDCEVCRSWGLETLCSQLSFEDCFDGLKNGNYDVIFVPVSTAMLSELEGYVVTSVQRDGVIFIRSNSDNCAGFNLPDEKIRLAFTAEETVYWDDDGTDPIIPASGWVDTEPSMWQHIDRMFGFSASSPNVIFRAEGDDNCMWTISESGRTGSGLWPCYFSSVGGEAGIGNGEVIQVNGILPTGQSIADGSYPYAFTYCAIYSPSSSYAKEIETFVAELQRNTQEVAP